MNAMAQRRLMVAGAVVGGLGLLAMLRSPTPPAPTPRPAPTGKPTILQVLTAIQAHRFPLPAPGHAFLVVIVNRTHGQSRSLPDPWDDWIGILRNHGGTLRWRCAVGSGEPGWLPMWGKSQLETPPEGVSRLAVPQFAPNAYGGGFHHWREDRPAFRQVGPLTIEIFKRHEGQWRGPVVSRGHHNAHTTNGRDWTVTAQRGVRDWSHGCPVVVNPAEHRKNLEAGGWTADIDGVRLSLVTLHARSLR